MLVMMAHLKYLTLFHITFALISTLTNAAAEKEPSVAPYVDATRMPENFLPELYKRTGLKAVTLAFVLGTGFGCTPSWGGEGTIDNPNILNNVEAFEKLGGKVILATGGAMGPYLETICGSASELANAYKTALDSVRTCHLDIDIESTINVDVMLNALKLLKGMIPNLTVSFTMMVQGDDYGITDGLGVQILNRAATLDVEVNKVNAMAMEFWTLRPSWGDAVVTTGVSVHRQLKEIWPSKSDEELWQMVGVTPMIGRNFNGRIFEIAHANQLVAWAKEKRVGLLSYWSLGRDNGNCPGGGVSPDCSSIAQSDLEFAQIFQQYADISEYPTPTKPSTTSTTVRPSTNRTELPVTTSTQRPTYPTESPSPYPSPSATTSRPTNPTQSPPTPPSPVDCSSGKQFIKHETDCDKFYWCINGKPVPERCAPGTVFDPTIENCNYDWLAQRNDCV